MLQITSIFVLAFSLMAVSSRKMTGDSARRSHNPGSGFLLSQPAFQPAAPLGSGQYQPSMPLNPLYQPSMPISPSGYKPSQPGYQPSMPLQPDGPSQPGFQPGNPGMSSGTGFQPARPSGGILVQNLPGGGLLATMNDSPPDFRANSQNYYRRNVEHGPPILSLPQFIYGQQL